MKRIILTLVVGLAALAVPAQGLKNVVINEILVKNTNSYADDHAHKVSWVEIYNSGYTKVNLAGTFLRLVQGTDTITYRIPKNDARTQLPAQGFVMFFCDASSNKGTFHTNFRLDPIDSVKWASLIGINDKLELLDQSGRVVIDAIEYDVNTQEPDVSFGRILNDDNEIMISKLSHITPLQGNDTKERIPKGELFRMEDPTGVVMAVIAMSVVFSALILLYLIFKNLGKFMVAGVKKKENAAAAAVSSKEKSKMKPNEDIDGETVAAIAIAIRKYEEDLRDIESTVLTINKVAKAYSPWSSKIYSMGQLPNKK